MSHPLAKLQELAISNTGFVFDPSTGLSYTVNGTGLAILNMLKEGAGHEAIVTALGEHFEGGDADVLRDLHEFMLILKQNRMIPDDFQFAK